ncbi:MAG: class I SAM-dependent methyltransferase [Candidatus Micrarchaeota archaeon]
MKLLKHTRSTEWWRAWRAFEKSSRKWQRSVELPAIARLCKFSKNKAALEVGAGVGRLAAKFAPECRALYAVESDERALKQLRKAAKKSKWLTVVEADLYALPFADGSFDCVYSAWVLQSRRIDLPRAVSEQVRVLKKKGKIVAVTENGEGDDAQLKELLGKKGNKRKREKIVADIKKLLRANGCKKIGEERRVVRFEFPYSIERTAEILRQIVVSGEGLDESKRGVLQRFLAERRKNGRIVFTQGASFVSAEK